MKKLIIATRKSQLALWQSEYVKKELNKFFPKLEIELKTFTTKGDKILDTPLAKIGGKGLFTKELEDAMLAGNAHIAVHSLKDVPTVFPNGLVLGAVTKRANPKDAFLSMKYESLDDLPEGAVVGTTSLRRRMQLLLYRNDLQIKSLRGNVNTRLKKLKDGEFDAIILATAGIKRLGFENEVKYFYPIPKKIMIPAMGQAALGIECINDPEVLKIVKVLNNKKSFIETKVERDFVDTLQGGCQVPIGINAKLKGKKIKIRAIVGMPDASEVLKEKLVVSHKLYESAGVELARDMIQKGALELLQKASKKADEIL